MQTTATISGMTCAHCVRAVFTSLAGVEGIKRADVTIGKAVIEHDGTVAPEDIRAAIALAGYAVTKIKIDRPTLPLAP
jgi:copper chaperone